MVVTNQVNFLSSAQIYKIEVLIMSKIEGWIDYKRREFCKDIQCKVQLLLDQEKEGSEKYEMIRNICKSDCIHTTYEFHHWLTSHKYEIVRKE